MIRKSLFWRCERFPCAFWLRRREDTMPSTADWSLHDVSPAPRQFVQELKKSPETAVWGRIWFCGNGKKRSMHAHRARKSNHQPSHIDDWMYVKLAMLKINVNENRVKNANFRGFLSKLPLPGSEMAGRSPRKGGPDRSRLPHPFAAFRERVGEYTTIEELFVSARCAACESAT